MKLKFSEESYDTNEYTKFRRKVERNTLSLGPWNSTLNSLIPSLIGSTL
jgi:hypothetical protein